MRWPLCLKGIDSFAVPPTLGGRYSALSPVGLFPAACVGMDIAGIMEGALSISKACENADVVEVAEEGIDAIEVGDFLGFAEMGKVFLGDVVAAICLHGGFDGFADIYPAGGDYFANVGKAGGAAFDMAN